MHTGHVSFASRRQICSFTRKRWREFTAEPDMSRINQESPILANYGGIQSKTTNIHIVTRSAFPLHCQNNPKPTNRFFFHRLVPNVLVSYHKVRPTRRDALHPFAHRVSMVLFAVPSLLPSLYVLARPLILEGTPRQGNLRSLHYARSLASCRSRAL